MNKEQIKQTLLFLFLNFLALGVGGLFTNIDGWYQELNKAPWTPPGWVFGAAWTSIMICFAFYMGRVQREVNLRSTFWKIYAVQWVLNVGWSPAFFYAHQMLLGLFIITALTALLFYFLLRHPKQVGWGYSLLLLPYTIWLCIATSLNAYAYWMN